MKAFLFLALLTNSTLVFCGESLFDFEVGKTHISEVNARCKIHLKGMNKVDILTVYEMDAIQTSEICVYPRKSDSVHLAFDDRKILVLIEVVLEGDLTKPLFKEFDGKYNAVALPADILTEFGGSAAQFKKETMSIALFYDDIEQKTMVTIFNE